MLCSLEARLKGSREKLLKQIGTQLIFRLVARRLMSPINVSRSWSLLRASLSVPKFPVCFWQLSFGFGAWCFFDAARSRTVLLGLSLSKRRERENLTTRDESMRSLSACLHVGLWLASAAVCLARVPLWIPEQLSGHVQLLAWAALVASSSSFSQQCPATSVYAAASVYVASSTSPTASDGIVGGFQSRSSETAQGAG